MALADNWQAIKEIERWELSMTNNHIISNVIDIEASGIHPHSYPIEVGIVRSDGSTYQSLIRPLPHWNHWDSEAELLHGISRNLLWKNGRNAKDVCHEINNFCRDEILYSDCWVHDSPWLTRLFADAGVSPVFRCSPVESILTEKQIINWSVSKRNYALHSEIKPHRALNDAIIISNVLHACEFEKIESLNAKPFESGRTRQVA